MSDWEDWEDESETALFWDNLADEKSVVSLGASDTSAEPPRHGVVGGRYRLGQKLGAGGMGEVYLAHDEVMGRWVALKLLLRHLTEHPSVIKRFRREARIMRELTSPHAVLIHDFGQAEDGSVYLAMEYLEGETLSCVLEREGRLDARRVIQIGLQVLDVLSDAHRLGIIHRDIKPANVFLATAPEGAPPVAKLLDFGVAKLWSADHGDITDAVALLGTPKYMSPEQVIADEIDARSDLYSLGMVMYKALSGSHPFEGMTFFDLMATEFNEPVEPLSKRRPGFAIPPELERIVMRVLEKDPDARYTCAAEMARDMRKLL